MWWFLFRWSWRSPVDENGAADDDYNDDDDDRRLLHHVEGRENASSVSYSECMYGCTCWATVAPLFVEFGTCKYLIIAAILKCVLRETATLLLLGQSDILVGSSTRMTEVAYIWGYPKHGPNLMNS